MSRKTTLVTCGIGLCAVLAGMGGYTASRHHRIYPGRTRISFPPTTVQVVIDAPHAQDWDFIEEVHLLLMKDGSVISYAEWQPYFRKPNGVLSAAWQKVFPPYMFSFVCGKLWYPSKGVDYSLACRHDVVANIILLRSENSDGKWHVLKIDAALQAHVIKEGIAIKDIAELPVIDDDPLGSVYVDAYQSAMKEDDRLRDLDYRL